MPAIRLTTTRVEQFWGRRALWPGFGDVEGDGAPVGEIRFEAPSDIAGGDPELLIKYLFTSEKLPIEVHPGDAAARARGFARGKDKAWLILSAEPHASIAIGTLSPMTRDELRAAALDGTIEEKVDWKVVKANDVFYSPAGTIHAIGPGLTLVEIQQNVDLTYRLYDYGRARELHVDDGVAVAEPVPYVAPFVPREAAPGRTILAAGPKLVMERWSKAGEGTLDAGAGPVWLVPLDGTGRLGEEALEPGGVWLAQGTTPLTLGDGVDLLLAYAGSEVADAIWE